MVIIAVFGSDVQRYRREFPKLEFARPENCPRCAKPGHLVGHGSYVRGCCDHCQVFAIRVKRFLCTLCRHTLSLLPSFCIPHRHYLAVTIQRVLTLRIQAEASWTAIRRRFAPSDLPAMTTCREWVRRFSGAARVYLDRLIDQFARWQLQPGKLELAVAEAATRPSKPQQLVAVVPHLAAWLRDNGRVLIDGGKHWLPALVSWGQAAKLGRLV